MGGEKPEILGLSNSITNYALIDQIKKDTIEQSYIFYIVTYIVYIVL